MVDARAARVRLWDWPVRIVHWSFVALVPGLWLTFRAGNMNLHERLGFVMLGLVLFRIYWGFVGSSTARFASFVKGPVSVATYIRGLFGKAGEPVVGHNALGGWSVVVLLSLLAIQVGLGLFAQDTDGIVSGPLTHYVSYDAADTARDWHELVFNILLVFIGLHLAAILFYAVVKRDNLVADDRRRQAVRRAGRRAQLRAAVASARRGGDQCRRRLLDRDRRAAVVRHCVGERYAAFRAASLPSLSIHSTAAAAWIAVVS